MFGYSVPIIVALGLLPASSAPPERLVVPVQVWNVADRYGDPLPDCYYRGGCRGDYYEVPAQPRYRATEQPSWRPKFQGRAGDYGYNPQYERDQPGYGYGGWGYGGYGRR